MARGVPMDLCGDALQLAASSDALQLAAEPVKLKCDQHELRTALRNLNLHRQDSSICRQMARATVAMYVACQNCDYYITKYSCKSLEQLANLVTQYALGIRRLEDDELKETQAAKDVPQDAGADPLNAAEARKRRARRVTIRLAMAANRSTWVSATEYAVFILTGAMHFSSHNEVPLFLSRAWYTMHACKRLLEGSGHGYLAETAHVPVSAIAFSMPSATQLPINVDTSSAAQLAASGAPQPAAIMCASDDDDVAEGDEE